MNLTHPTEPPTLNPRSIFLVDDNTVLRDRLALAFQERGYEVAVAGNYDEALAVFSRRPTALAVLDLRMPGKPGLVLLQALKGLSPQTKFSSFPGLARLQPPLMPCAWVPRIFCPSRLMRTTS